VSQVKEKDTTYHFENICKYCLVDPCRYSCGVILVCFCGW